MWWEDALVATISYCPHLASQWSQDSLPIFINRSQMGPAWVSCLPLDLSSKVLIIEEETGKTCRLGSLKSSPSWWYEGDNMSQT